MCLSLSLAQDSPFLHGMGTLLGYLYIYIYMYMHIHISTAFASNCMLYLPAIGLMVKRVIPYELQC